MDAKQIEATGKQLVKAASEGDPASTVLALLVSLKEWKASEETLRQTRIGVAVNKLRQFRDARVQSEAARLIHKWKGDVKSGNSSSSGGAPRRAPTNGTASPAPGARPKSGTASPAPGLKLDAGKSEPSNRRKWSAEEREKRNAKADAVDTGVTGNQVRDACVKMMYDGLAFMSGEAVEEVLEVARKVELAAFNQYQPETSAGYKQKMRSLYQNLKMKGNIALRRDVTSGKIEAKRFVTMSSDELKSNEKRASDAALEKENMNKAMVPSEEKSISTSLECGKCKARKVSYSQAQTRSADEPMTTFCECVSCGNRWKFS